MDRERPEAWHDDVPDLDLQAAPYGRVTPEIAPLPPRWRGLFALELPIVAATLLYWLAASDHFLADGFGVTATPGTRALLRSYAAVVGTTVLWLYARILARPTVHWPTFRLYQEALFVGDVAIVALWAHGLAAGTLPTGPALGSIGMATTWGLVRVVFLARAQPAAPTAGPP